MNVRQLQEFLVVAQEKQITAATKRLYMAQPPLSYQMKQLEKELGTKLFTRNSYGIQLTAAGESFQRYAQKIVRLAQSAEEELNQEQKGELGTIHLGLISSTGSLIPNQAMQQLTTFYPGIKFEITEANTMQLIDQLTSNLIDVAIVRTPFNTRGLRVAALCDDQIVAVGDPNSYPVLSQSLAIKAFDHQPLIIYRRFAAIFNNSFAQLGINPHYVVKCDDARTAIQQANGGMGIALVPQLSARSCAQTKIVPITDQPWDSQIQLVWQKETLLQPVTRKFINLLTNPD